MKIRLKTLMAGPQGIFMPGTVIDVDGEEFEALISGGYADRLVNPPETAAIDPGMKAIRPACHLRKVE